jgi:hypothetical protein
MSAPSTPSYMPLNPKALTFFKEVQNSNYLNGERFFSSIWLQNSYFPPVAFLVKEMSSWNSFEADLVPVRCCCFMITLLLWTRRYDLFDFGQIVVTFKMIRSHGSGRWSSAFYLTGCALTSALLRLQWRLPKIVFLLNRYVITLLVLCAMSNSFTRMYENNPFERQAAEDS